eukprot:1311832-Amphidinium_carterae.1
MYAVSQTCTAVSFSPALPDPNASPKRNRQTFEEAGLPFLRVTTPHWLETWSYARSSVDRLADALSWRNQQYSDPLHEMLDHHGSNMKADRFDNHY